MISYKHKKTGFTLIELLVVISIIGLLLALLSPAAKASRRKAQVSKAQAMVASLQLAISMYEADTGSLPPDEDAAGNVTCKVLVDKLTTGKTGSETDPPPGWKGPYIEFKPSDLDANGEVIDPWGNPYIYIANNGTGDASLPARHPNTYDLQTSGGEATN